MPVRIVIVDNHPVVKAGLKKILCEQPGLEVVGDAACCDSGCAEIEQTAPDLVIFDIELDGHCGPTVIGNFRGRFPDLPAILFTQQTERQTVVEALKQRIQGFVVKTSPVDRLLQAVGKVAAGQPYLDPEISSVLMTGFTEHAGSPDGLNLSTRQMAVLRLLAEGLSNKEIARDLYITESTVKFHVSAILQALEARNRAHAVRIAENRGWIQTDPPTASWGAGKPQFAS